MPKYGFFDPYIRDISTESAIWSLYGKIWVRENPEAVAWGYLVKKGVTEYSTKCTRKNQCQRLFFNKLQTSGLQLYHEIAKEILAQLLSVNFAKFSRTPLLIEHVSSGCFWKPHSAIFYHGTFDAVMVLNMPPRSNCLCLI